MSVTSLVRRAAVAAGLVGALWSAALVVPAAGPVASAAECSDVDVVFARGSGEFPGLGIVGTPLVGKVRSALSGLTVSSYAVNYAADIAQTSAGAGANDMTAHVVSTAAACPGTRFVVGGYSQGASVTDIAIGIRTPLGRGASIPAEIAPRVAAVTTFGNPLGLSRRTIQQASPTYAARAVEACNPGDPVCGGTGTGTGAGHLSYGGDGATDRAAAFVAQQVRAGQA